MEQPSISMTTNPAIDRVAVRGEEWLCYLPAVATGAEGVDGVAEEGFIVAGFDGLL